MCTCYYQFMAHRYVSRKQWRVLNSLPRPIESRIFEGLRSLLGSIQKIYLWKIIGVWKNVTFLFTFQLDWGYYVKYWLFKFIQIEFLNTKINRGFIKDYLIFKTLNWWNISSDYFSIFLVHLSCRLLDDI